MVVPSSIRRSAFQTLVWNGVPVVATGRSFSTPISPLKYRRIA